MQCNTSSGFHYNFNMLKNAIAYNFNKVRRLCYFKNQNLCMQLCTCVSMAPSSLCKDLHPYAR